MNTTKPKKINVEEYYQNFEKFKIIATLKFIALFPNKGIVRFGNVKIKNFNDNIMLYCLYIYFEDNMFEISRSNPRNWISFELDNRSQIIRSIKKQVHIVMKLTNQNEIRLFFIWIRYCFSVADELNLLLEVCNVKYELE